MVRPLHPPAANAIAGAPSPEQWCRGPDDGREASLNNKEIDMRTVLALLMAGALALGGLDGSAVAGDKVPQTAAEHEEAAKDFANKAKGHRAEAEMHRKMAEMYQTKIKGPANRKPNIWLHNMVNHCKELAKSLDAAAAAEEKAADTLTKQAQATPQETAATKAN